MRSDEIAHGEIIIVRRGGGDDHDDHHGGVWKIAFADFMTAMMAFFLVMWLINAANEETKKAVASYFTPIKLTDRTTNPKGLNESKYGDPDDQAVEPAESESTYTSGGKLNEKVPDPVQIDEQALFTDPYAVLSEIAGGLVSGPEEAGKRTEEKNEGGGLGITGGDAYYDPFDPASWNTELGLAKKAESGGEHEKSGVSYATPPQNDIAAILAREGNLEIDPGPDLASNLDERSGPGEEAPMAQRESGAGEALPNSDSGTSLGADGLPVKDSQQAGESPAQEMGTREAPVNDMAPVDAAETEIAKVEPAQRGVREEAPQADGNPALADNAAEYNGEEDDNAGWIGNDELAEKLRDAIGDKLAAADQSAPLIEVQATGQGVLVSLSDEHSFGMFDVGSAVPRAKTVNIIGEIGKMLATLEGEIIVSGHTDARKFSGGDYDNWRLSTDRAHIARHMLIRGGLNGERIARVEGYAASRPKLAEDPLSEVNRRIEIFLRRP